MIGSDPTRNLIYAVNGDDNDEDCVGMTGYGTQPPAFGVAVLRGPLMDANGLDDPVENTMPAWNGMRFNDGVPDDERLGLSRAMYFLRDGNPAMTAPQLGADFMNYLHGRWKDGTPLTYGGSGYGGTTDARFAFPDATDPLGVGVGEVRSLLGMRRVPGTSPVIDVRFPAWGPSPWNPGCTRISLSPWYTREQVPAGHQQACKHCSSALILYGPSCTITAIGARSTLQTFPKRLRSA